MSLISPDAGTNVLASEEPAYTALTPLTWELREVEATIPVGTRKIKWTLGAVNAMQVGIEVVS